MDDRLDRRYGGADGFWQVVYRDLRHHLDGPGYEKPLQITPVRLLRALCTPEFRVVLSFRIYSALHRRGFRMAAYFMYLRSKKKYSCDLFPECRIGAGFRVAHCSDIVVGPMVDIGSDVEVFNGVTFGNQNTRGGNWAMPKVGSRVMIGTGAKVLGGIELGDACTIGANSVVIRSVPPGATAVGIPARIIAPR